MQRIEIKRGASLSLAGFVNLPDGEWLATCCGSYRLGKEQIEFDVQLEPPAVAGEKHKISISKSATEMDVVPCGDVRCELSFIDAQGFVIKSETFVVGVLSGACDG